MEKKKKQIVKKENVVQFFTEVSKGVNKVISRKCKWEGKTICKKWVHGCRWRAVGKSGRRKYCCKHLSVCNNGNCIKKNSKCKWSGCQIDRSEIKTCKWISHTKYIRRKRCCTHAKICKCAKCHLVKIKCSVCNRCIIRRQPKKSCSTKKKLEDMELKNNVVNGFISVEENYVKNLIKNVKLQE